MRFNGSCPECGAKVSRFHKFDFGERFKGYRCENDHVITVMDDSEVISIKYPSKQLEACPKCGRQLAFNIMSPPPGPVSTVPENAGNQHT